MAEYALIDIATNTVREFQRIVGTPSDVTHKGLKWLPVVVISPAPTDTQVREGPVITVEATRVTRVWTVREKTPAELDAEKDSYINNLDRLGFGIDFDHENRLRALEAKQPLTAAQFKAILKARL